MKTKGQRKAEDRRRLRKREKTSDALHDIPLGRACRRGYGVGYAK